MSRNLGILVAVVGVALIAVHFFVAPDSFFASFHWAGIIALALGILIFFSAGKSE